MSGDDILAALDFRPRLCGWCAGDAVVEFSWDKPCGCISRFMVCDTHVPVFLEQATVPARWRCPCGRWAVFRMDDCLQVVAVAR